MHPTDLATERQRISAELKASRERKAITILRLAQISGLSRKTIGWMESGRRSFSIDSLTIYKNAIKKHRK